MGFIDKLAAKAAQAADKALTKAQQMVDEQQRQQPPANGAHPQQQQQQGFMQPGAPVPAAGGVSYAAPVVYQQPPAPPPPPQQQFQQPFFSPQAALPQPGPPPPPPPQAAVASVPRPLGAPAAAVGPGGKPQPLRRKALLVGVAYFNTQNHLKGTLNDTNCLLHLLKTRFGFTDDGIVVLRDDDPRPAFQPTKQNIYNACRWLVGDARPGDSLFFSFSGHGSQQRCLPGDREEADGMDETLLPVDFKYAGHIRDNEVNAWLVAPLPAGATLHIILDACHSGSGADLPYSITWCPQGAPAWTQVGRKGSAGIVWQFSACSDGTTAADTNSLSGNAFTGAATFSFIHAIETFGTNQTYATVLAHMNEVLRSLGKTSIKPASGGATAIGAAAPLALGLALGPLGLLTGLALGQGIAGGKASHQVPHLNCSQPLDIHSLSLSL
jgi:metacaspase-1